MTRADDLYGKNDINALGTGPSPLVPFPPAGQRKDIHSYDESKVHEAIRSGQKPEPVDPRILKSTQPSLDRAGVRHYFEGHEGLYHEGTDPGNKTPVVYNRDGNHIVLTGHHRATAALLRGEQFNAVVVHGGWGPKR